MPTVWSSPRRLSSSNPAAVRTTISPRRSNTTPRLRWRHSNARAGSPFSTSCRRPRPARSSGSNCAKRGRFSGVPSTSAVTLAPLAGRGLGRGAGFLGLDAKMAALRGKDQKRTERARSLRRTPTSAEFALWTRIRARQLGGFKFVRQEPIDRYYVDFVCRKRRLIVELDGGQHAEHR